MWHYDSMINDGASSDEDGDEGIVAIQGNIKGHCLIPKFTIKNCRYK